MGMHSIEKNQPTTNTIFIPLGLVQEDVVDERRPELRASDYIGT